MFTIVMSVYTTDLEKFGSVMLCRHFFFFNVLHESRNTSHTGSTELLDFCVCVCLFVLVLPSYTSFILFFIFFFIEILTNLPVHTIPSTAEIVIC